MDVSGHSFSLLTMSCENLTNLLFLERLTYDYLLLELNVVCKLHVGNLGYVTDDISKGRQAHISVKRFLCTNGDRSCQTSYKTLTKRNNRTRQSYLVNGPEISSHAVMWLA